MRGFEMGGFHLDASAGRPTEACLTMVATIRAGSPVFDNLSNIRFTLETPKGPSNTREAQAPPTSDLKKGALPTKAAVLGAHKAKAHKRGGEAKPNSEAEQPGSLYAYDWITLDSEYSAEEEVHPFLSATPGMKRAQRDAYAAAAARRAKEGLRLMGNESGPGHLHNNSSAVHAQAGWQQLRREYLWPDGQGVMESLFTPYESEGIYTCMKCQPDV